MAHLILLGDSIFDNAAYVRGGPDVVTQLNALLPSTSRATLLAVDGAVTRSVQAQLQRLPADATALALSVGGNDALGHVSLLDRRATRGGEPLAWFADAADAFARDYDALLTRIAATGLPCTVCTIYEGNLDPSMRAPARAALAIFNDTIQRTARRAGFPVVELRDICTEPADYANPIEPSVQGGAKIAAAIAVLGLS